jgi:hypothetical protein
MTAEQRPPTFPMQEWLVESLRATIFPVPGVASSPDTWWRDTIGTDPETRTVKPATREHLEEGPFDGGKLGLIINSLGVIQWQVTPEPPRELPAGIPSAGALLALLPPFMAALEKWLPMSPVASRLALGVVVHAPVPGHREGYERLGTYLRQYVTLDPEGSSDFLYRINRPRASTTPVQGLRINRLSTWAVAKLTLLATSVAIQGRVGVEHYACRVDLDINTVPTFEGTFGPAVMAEVIGELRQLALEILAEGDIP